MTRPGIGQRSSYPVKFANLTSEVPPRPDHLWRRSTGERLTRTLSARYYKDGAEILISMGDDGPPRRLTCEECARLMGFSRDHLGFDFVIPDGVSDVQAYRQFGNSVVVPQFTWIGSAIRDQAGDVFAIRMAGTPAR